MSCGCQTQYQRRAGGRYLDQRAGGIITGRPDAAPPDPGPGAPPPAALTGSNKCWPQGLRDFATQKWAVDFVKWQNEINQTPVVREIYNTSGGQFLTAGSTLLEFAQYGCDLERFGPAYAGRTADNLDGAANLYGNALFQTALNALALIGLPAGMGAFAAGMSGVFRCAARGFRALAQGQVQGGCVVAGCVEDLAKLVQAYGLTDFKITLPPEMTSARAECAAGVKDPPVGAFGLPTLRRPPGSPVSAATGAPIASPSREEERGDPRWGLGLPIAAVAAYLLFVR